MRAHTRLPVLSAADLASVSAFARQIGGTEAAVGPPATATGVRGRYVRFEALSEVAGNPWTSMAEFYMLDKAGQPLSRTGWRITGFDTQETAGEDGQAANVLDGNASTIWHTTWSSGNAPYPHWIVVDTGALRDFGGFRYQPRTGVPNGTVDGYRLSVSTDGVAWGQPVKQGNLSALGAPAATKSVLFGG